MQGDNALVSGQNVIKNFQWWESFFNSGAFLRVSEDQVLLWAGPFESFSGRPKLGKSLKFSVAYMDFFGSELELKLAESPPLQLACAEVQSGLLSYLKHRSEPKFGRQKRSDFVNHGFPEFEKTIQSFLGKIQRGELEKAVPVIFSRSSKTATVEDLATWMTNLLQTPGSLYAFGFWNLGQGIMGATPEILFHRRAEKMTSMALAGTMPRSEIGKRNSLLKDPKELHEHELVVEDLVTQLSKWGPVTKKGPQILELPSLLHLKTMLEVDRVRANSQELIQHLHPTPALGVSPRAYGYHWMQSTSDQEGRRLFGAPILFSIPGTEDEQLCLVAIRNIQWDDNGCRIGAGCGVVKESMPQQEWAELMQKTNSVMQMLGLEGSED